MSAIQIHTNLTAEHSIVLQEYLRGESRLTREQWHRLREAIDLLGQSTVTFQGRAYTFRQFYETYIDRAFADIYLSALIAAEDLSQDAPRLQAATARQIVQWVQQQAFYQKGQAESRLLLTFCLYWWAAFALGYAFEEEIFRDLRAAGIAFACHDITNRVERLSAFDLTVREFRGDVKYSTYFLTAGEVQTTEIDFFITRVYLETNGRFLRVVFLTVAAWEAIDGFSTPTTLEDAASLLPTTASVQVAGMTFVLITYEDWKRRVSQSIGATKGDDHDGGTNNSEHE